MDSKKPIRSEVPERLQCAIENVIREATTAGFAIIGLAFCGEPAALVLLRNTKDDPVRMFEAATDLLKYRSAAGAPVEEQIVGRVN